MQLAPPLKKKTPPAKPDPAEDMDPMAGADEETPEGEAGETQYLQDMVDGLDPDDLKELAAMVKAKMAEAAPDEQEVSLE